MVFQNPDNQIVSSIVEDDVAFGPENLGVEPEEIRKRVADSLASVNMGEYKNKSPHMLSGGQKQRIAIAGAVAMRPECIVFDEPTSMLDPKGRREVVGIIKQLNAEGITTVLITHFMEEAAAADRIIIVDLGKAVMAGTPAEIFSQKDKLEELGLDIPMTVRMAGKLRERGIDIPPWITEEDKLIEYLTERIKN
jgi:energy-coupling factor transport system ATP-binding protein